MLDVVTDHRGSLVWTKKSDAKLAREKFGRCHQKFLKSFVTQTVKLTMLELFLGSELGHRVH